MGLKYINGVIGAPEALGPYSQAVVVDGFAFLSGQIPLHPETGEVIPGGIIEQTEQVMKNIIAVLAHLGTDFSQVCKTTIFLTDLANFQAVNATYAKWMGEYKPARSTIQVAALPKSVGIEIEMIVSLKPDPYLTAGHTHEEDLTELHSEGFCCQK